MILRAEKAGVEHSIGPVLGRPFTASSTTVPFCMWPVNEIGKVAGSSADPMRAGVSVVSDSIVPRNDEEPDALPVSRVKRDCWVIFSRILVESVISSRAITAVDE